MEIVLDADVIIKKKLDFEMAASGLRRSVAAE